MSGTDTETPQSSKELAQARRAAFASVAEGLAQQVAGQPTRPFSAGIRLSKTNVMRVSADGGMLVVLVARGESAAHIDEALAFGLSCQADRDLLLVLPAGGRSTVPPWQATARRLPWIATPVRLFTYSDSEVCEQAIPARVEVRNTLPPLHSRDVRPHALSDEQRAWVAHLVGQVADRTDVAHRASYLAWHAGGRQVLRVKRRRHGLEVIAGVNTSRPGVGRPPPVELLLTGPLTAEQSQVCLDAVVAAIDARGSGEDAANLEHLLQHGLATEAGVRALGLVGPVLRELPARRIGGGRAYVDLLGVDRRGRIHIVESKLGHDLMLALQGLDYWIWLDGGLREVVAHLRAEGFRLPDRPAVLLDFVVGSKADDGGAPELRTLLPQIEALDGAVRWRIGAVSGWREGQPAIRWWTRHEAPVALGRAEPPRFERRLQSHLSDGAHGVGGLQARVFLRDVEQAVLPEALPALRSIREAGLAHRFLSHVRSSQLFAINLFGGLSAGQLLVLARTVVADVLEVDAPVFEYMDPLDGLGEKPDSGGHQTQVDVLLRCRTASGRHLLLIEVKLSEDDFGYCTGYQAAGNRHRDVTVPPTPSCRVRIVSTWY